MDWFNNEIRIESLGDKLEYRRVTHVRVREVWLYTDRARSHPYPSMRLRLGLTGDGPRVVEFCTSSLDRYGEARIRAFIDAIRGDRIRPPKDSVRNAMYLINTPVRLVERQFSITSQYATLHIGHTTEDKFVRVMRIDPDENRLKHLGQLEAKGGVR